MDNQRTISQGILEKVSNLPPRLIPTMPSLIMVGANELAAVASLKPGVKLFLSTDNAGSPSGLPRGCSVQAPWQS